MLLFGIIGHGAFSENNRVNDIVGLIVHSALLTPYHSWKITHRKHHSNTGSCEHDEAFVPFTADEMNSSWYEILYDSPLFHLMQVMFYFSLGWMPMYLGFNFANFSLNTLVTNSSRLGFNGTGPRKYQNGPKCHFNPKAVFFSPKDRPSVVLSDIGFIVALMVIGFFAYTFTLPVVLRLYILPYMAMNAFLVLITLLHHTDTYVPHFREGEWTWLRGSLCTVDRSYGKILDVILHHITDTHVCHHIFSKMPFYHCVEATEAIKPILGKYYLRDETPIIPAMWRAMTQCIYVQNDGQVVFYRKKITNKIQRH